MKRIAFALSAIIAAAPVWAETIKPQDAHAHIGETATIMGRASIQEMLSGEVYMDFAGRGDHAPVSAYVSRWNRNRFPLIANLDGKMVKVTGVIGSFRYRPEIFLTDPAQIAVK